MIKTISIDPAVFKIGANILSLEDKKMSYVKSWQIFLKGNSLQERLYDQFVQLEKIIQEFLPLHSMAVEETFVNSDTRVNAKGETTFKFTQESPLKLSMSRGVCYALAGKYGLPVYEYSNTECKKYLTGNAIASKNMVIKAANTKFKGNFQEDESCSLAVGNRHLINLIEKNLI